MAVRVEVHQNTYKDSVSLMRIAADMEALPALRRATANMATPSNLELILNAGFKINENVGPNDLVIAAEGKDKAALDEAFVLAKIALEAAGNTASAGESAEEKKPKSLETALEQYTTPNIALISCPGDYAAAEAMKSLRLGLNVMMFSDNVSIEEERTLKEYADANDLLMMGPDCGTAIIHGTPLGFANKVQQGSVGIVAASGTGLQQVACLLDQQEIGLSHAIGTGGRDLHREIGGTTMSQALLMLAEDDATEFIVLISKPPSREIAERIFQEASSTTKPVIINFLGNSTLSASLENNIYIADTLEKAAEIAANLAQGKEPIPKDTPPLVPSTELADVLVEEQKYIRGLYSGGTFCYEAQLLMNDELDVVWSTTPIEKKFSLNDPLKSTGHTVIDLGDDFFTQGRPHPMIDQKSRRERLLQEARDPECAVILFDVVLGFGAHDNPAEELVETMAEAQQIADADQRRIIFVGFLCGTKQDPQNLNAQTQILRNAGTLLASSNAEAVRMAINIVKSR
jgi:FdrA protein